MTTTDRGTGADGSRVAADITMRFLLSMLAALSHVTVLRSSPVDTERLIAPEEIVYEGAFMLPRSDGSGGENATFSYGGIGLAYFPRGDAEGDADGYPGSLFGVGHVYDLLVAEVSIPRPVVTRDVDELPAAGYLQRFHSITGGLEPVQNQVRTAGLEYLPAHGQQTEDKLYFTQGHHWMHFDEEIGGRYQPTHFWADRSLATPAFAGPWALDSVNSYTCSGYLFEIPGDWAERFTPGRLLAAGGHREHIGGSYGPSLYACAPWEAGNPPAAGSSIDATVLLRYGLPPDSLVDCKHSDRWTGGAWLTKGDKSAVLIAGLKGVGGESYGVDNPLGGKGWYTEAYEATLLLYDPDTLGAVALGEIPSHAVQPYARKILNEHFFPSNAPYPGGVGYDRARGLLFVAQRRASGGDVAVHVYRLTNPSGSRTGVPAATRERMRGRSLAIRVHPHRTGRPVVIRRTTGVAAAAIYSPEGRLTAVVTRQPGGAFSGRLVWDGKTVAGTVASPGVYLAIPLPGMR